MNRACILLILQVSALDKLLWFSSLPNCDLSEMKDTLSSVFLLPFVGSLVHRRSEK